MEILWASKGQNEYIIFKFGDALISISKFYDSKDLEDDYDFLDARFSFTRQLSVNKIWKFGDFWDYVPEDQKQFVKHSLIKTSFNG